MNTNTKTMPTYFISHGGGPWPWLDGHFKEAFKVLRSSLERMPGELPEKPKAILMVSGHWEEDDFTIMSNQNPGMVYDYSGFPEHTYRIKYPAPGSPELASRVRELLKDRGIESRFDPVRGFDHGTFVPMAVSYPNADVPVLQLSLRRDYDPEAHLALGRALAPLRGERHRHCAPHSAGPRAVVSGIQRGNQGYHERSGVGWTGTGLLGG